MDPLSVAGSIAGLVSLGDAVFRKLYQYAKTVKKAEQEVLDLKNEVISLTGILHNLKIVAQDLEQDADFNNSIRVVHVNSCLATLYRLDDGLKKIEYPQDQRFRSGLRKLAWPFKSGEAKSLGEEIRRHRETLSLALSADTATALIRCLTSQEAMTADIKDVRRHLANREDVETRIAINDNRQRILRYFLVVNPLQNYKTSLGLRHPNTGFWLLEGGTFRSWLQQGSRLWLSGIPGAGKTVLAGLIIKECISRATTDRAVAYFYCDYKNVQSQDTVNIFSSLAAQLAIQHEGCFGLLEKYYRSLHPARQLESRPETTELMKLLQEMADMFDDVRYIIDGLDECGDNTEEVGEWLKRLACKGGDSISVAILSRDELNIRNILGPPTCAHIEIAAQTKDIEHFVRTAIEERSDKSRLRIRNPNFKEEIIQTLVSRAHGMFRWVTCQLDHLCELPSDAHRRKALNTLPTTLYETYERILLRIPATFIEIVRRTLLWTIHAPPQRRIRNYGLMEIISIEPDDHSINIEARTDEDDIMKYCSSLIRSRDGYFELAHFSVQEYLNIIDEQSKLRGFRFHATPAVEQAQICLRYLCLSDFDSPPPSTVEDVEIWFDRYPFHRHAAGNWLDYARDNLDDADISKLLQSLFHPNRLYNCMSFLLSRFIYLYERHNVVHDLSSRDHMIRETIVVAAVGNVGTLRFAAYLGLKEICMWIVSESFDVNQKSLIRTPIICCLLGPYYSCLENKYNLNWFSRQWVQDSGISRAEIADILLRAGADFRTQHLYNPSLGYHVIFRQARPRSPPGHTQMFPTNILSTLVRHGLRIEDDAMRMLDECGKEVLEPLLQVIQDYDNLNISSEIVRRILHRGTACSIEIFSTFSVLASPSFEELIELVVSCVKFDQLDTFQKLLVNSPFDPIITHPTIDGTLLHVAAANHSVKLMQALMALGLDPSLTNRRGRTVLHESATLKHDGLTRLLIKIPESIKADYFGCTVWHEAARKGADRTLELLMEHYGTSSPDLLRVSDAGRTPIFEAIIAGEESTSLLILEAMRLNGNVSEDWRLVHYSTASGLYKVIDRLKEYGFDLAIYSDSERSALHFLTRKTSFRSLETLLSNGVNPDEQDSAGKSALYTFLDGSRKKNLAEAGYYSDLELEKLDFEIIESLITVTGVSLKDSEGCMAWSHFCTHYTRRTLAVEDLDWDLHCFGKLGRCLAEKGAMTAYDQDGNAQSAFSLFTESCLDAMSRRDIRLHAGLSTPLAKLMIDILEDCTISTAITNDHSFVRLMLWSINEDLELLFQRLLVLGTSPGSYYNGENAIEKLCKLRGTTGMLKACLQFVTPAMLEQNGRSGLNSLHLLCSYHDGRHSKALERLDVLLEMGVNLDIQSSYDGLTALHLAVGTGFIGAFESLIYYGAKDHLLDNDQAGIVAHAIFSGRVDMLEELTKHCNGYTPWEQRTILKVSWDRSFVSESCTIRHLAALERYKVSEVLSKHGHFQLVDDRSQRGYTPLHIACAISNLKTAEWLISQGADVNALTNRGETALHMAMKKGDLRLIRVLIEAEARFTPDKDGIGPEGCAPSHVIANLLKLLRELNISDSVLARLHKVNVTKKLFIAIKQKDFGYFQYLMDQDNDLKSRRSPSCDICTPLIRAIVAKSWDIVDLLLDNDPVLEGFGCKRHVPSQPSHFSIVSLAITMPAFNSRLLKLLRMCLAHRTHWSLLDCSAFHLAANHNSDGIDILIKHVKEHEDLYKESLNIGKTNGPQGQVVSQLIDSQSKSPWDLDGILVGGATPMHLAMLNEQPNAIEKIILNGANINVQNEEGITPLSFAIYYGHESSASMMLRYGADALLGDCYLTTPLMVACKRGVLPAIDMLTPYESGRSAVDVAGKSALHYSACPSGGTAFMRLIKAGWDPYLLDHFGVSAIYKALAIEKLSAFIYMMAFDLEHLVPTSDAPGYPSIFYGKPRQLRHFIKRFPANRLHEMISYRPEHRELPLCDAGRNADIASMTVLIEAGVDIELLNNIGNTALIVSCLAGQINSVKLLVRRGAKLQSYFEGKPMNALDAASHHPHIVDWLLVRRHTEQKRLANVAQSETPSQKAWSGIWTLQVPLEGSYGRRVGQSRLDWVKYIHGLKEEWRRMVPLGWNVVSHLAPVPGKLNCGL